MSAPTQQCPNCQEPLRFDTVDLKAFPPRAMCPNCGVTVSNTLLFARVRATRFVYVSLVLGLAVGVGFGIAISLLSRDWSYSYRFSLLAITLIVGAIIIPLIHRRGRHS